MKMSTILFLPSSSSLFLICNADYWPQKQKQQQDANADAAAGTKKKKVTAAQLRVQKGMLPSTERSAVFEGLRC